MTTQMNPPTECGSRYRLLSRQVKAAGLLLPRPWYYVRKVTITAALFFGGWWALFVIGNSWLNLVTAVFLAVMSTQMAMVGHDAGHQQIFRSKRAAYRMNLVIGNVLLGMSAGWWDRKHNGHHANPNHLGKDPDVQIGPVAFTKDQAGGRGPFASWFIHHQALLFFPLLTLEGFALQVHGFGAVIDGTVKGNRRVIEGLLLIVHLAAYLGIVFTVLAPLQAVVFILVHQGLFGVYMGLTFAPNHKGMPYTNEIEQDYLLRQVLTSRNVRGSWLVDWLLGGLNYQIEHHLFQNMPRPNLRRARPLVQEFCAAHEVSYTETGLAQSYREVLRYLQFVGEDLLSPPIAGLTPAAAAMARPRVILGLRQGGF